MYGWIWRHLPGNAWVRGVTSLVLVLAVVYLLFQYVFPWAEPLLPFNEVTVDNNDGMNAVSGVAAVL
jgi:Fe2+ transport system protein B